MPLYLSYSADGYNDIPLGKLLGGTESKGFIGPFGRGQGAGGTQTSSLSFNIELLEFEFVNLRHDGGIACIADLAGANGNT